MKKIIPGFLIALASGFMFFIFEPINLYSTNTNDFWFDFYIIIKPLILAFIVYFLIISTIYIIVYYLNKILFKKLPIYKILIIMGFAFLIAFYIQGNFLIKNLPTLDGTSIIWENYKNDSIISIVVFLISLISVSIFAFKLKFEKFSKIFSIVAISIIVMLTTSLLSTVFTNNVFKKKERILTATVKNINTTSSNKNFYIFLVDTVDSKCFNELLQKSNKKDIFNDFTYYPDTMGGYTATRDSIPFIFSGIWNENKTDFPEYYNNCMEKSELIDGLIEDDYLINLYDYELMWNTEKAMKVDNLYNNMKINSMSFCRNILKYIGFKYLPYQLKKYSKIETMNFDNCKVPGEDGNFLWGIKHFHDAILTKDLEKIDRNYFSFIHLEGAHVPFNLDKDLNFIEGGTYEQKLEGNITTIEKFIRRLKENNVYDNSVIIVLSDHGYNFGQNVGRQNPILYIKGIDEHHELFESDIPVSFEDLPNAYKDLLNGKKSEELFQNVDRNRKRRYLLYEYEKEDHMVEYEQTGTADNEETLIPTGREFNR